MGNNIYASTSNKFHDYFTSIDTEGVVYLKKQL